MKRFILISVLFAITAMAWAQQPAIGKCESKEGFTFFQVTDPQLGFHSKDKNLQWTIDNLKAMVSIINREHPAFVIITGDMIHRHYKKNQVEAYRSVIATVDKDIPVFHIPGNHDMPNASSISTTSATSVSPLNTVATDLSASTPTPSCATRSLPTSTLPSNWSVCMAS